MLSRRRVPLRHPNSGLPFLYTTCTVDATKATIGNHRSLGYNICRFVVLVIATILVSPDMASSFAANAVEVPLLVEKVDGCVSENGLIRLPQEHVQRDPRHIVMEGEEATALSLDDKIFSDPDGLRGVDPEASNGRFICYMSDARYRFKVVTPGKYVVWMRVLSPWAGIWCHTEMMDDAGLTLDNDYRLKPELQAARAKKGGGPRSLLDVVMQPNDTRLKKWIWIKPTLGASQQPSIHELSAGIHELKFDYLGGIRLDKIILTRDINFTPEGKGPPAPAGSGSQAGMLITEDVHPKAVKGWRELRGVIDPAGGRVAMYYSTDGGSQWTPFTDLTVIKSLPTR